MSKHHELFFSPYSSIQDKTSLMCSSSTWSWIPWSLVKTWFLSLPGSQSTQTERHGWRSLMFWGTHVLRCSQLNSFMALKLWKLITSLVKTWSLPPSVHKLRDMGGTHDVLRVSVFSDVVSWVHGIETFKAHNFSFENMVPQHGSSTWFLALTTGGRQRDLMGETHDVLRDSCSQMIFPVCSLLLLLLLLLLFCICAELEWVLMSAAAPLSSRVRVKFWVFCFFSVPLRVCFVEGNL